MPWRTCQSAFAAPVDTVACLGDSLEVSSDTPWRAIQRLAAAGSTGELIVASDAIEIHVYLLDGRLAWATSSTAHNEFLRRLVEDHGIANDVLRDVIEECRRTRGRLGETLIAWGVATADQIRDALRCQVEEALAATTAHPRARCLFLPRRLEYALELTFRLSELRMRDAEAVPGSSDAAQAMVAAVLEGVPEALWVEVVERGKVVACAVRGALRPTAAIEELQNLAAEHSLEALTLRSTANGAVLGQRVPGSSGSVWCAVGGGAKLGVTSAVLAAAVGAQTLGTLTEPDDEPWCERADPGLSLMPSVFSSATRTSDEMVAGFMLADRGGPAGVWRGAVGLDEHAVWARRLAPALGAAIRDTFSVAVGSLLYDHVALRAIAGGNVYYGTLVSNGSTAVWLVLQTWASQGLGWALLQAVARQVGADV